MAYARDHLAAHREAESLLPPMYHGLLHEVRLTLTLALTLTPYTYPYPYPYPYP